MKTLGMKLKKICLALLLTVSMVAQVEQPLNVMAESVPVEQVFDKAQESTKYQLSTNSYMSYLKIDYSNDLLFSVAFVEKAADGTVMFNQLDHDEVLEKSFIRVNGHSIWSFKDAGLQTVQYGREPSVSSFSSKNLRFISEFIKEDKLNVEVLMPDQTIVRQVFVNKVDKEKRVIEDVIPSNPDQGGTIETPTVDDNTNTDVEPSDLTPVTGFKILWAGYDEENSEWSEKWGVKFDHLDEFQTVADYVSSKGIYNNIKTITVNGQQFDTGWDQALKTTAMVENLLLIECGELLTALQSTGKNKNAVVKFVFKDGTYVQSGDVIVPEKPVKPVPTVKPSEPVKEEMFKTAKVRLVKADEINTESMSGAVLLPDAEIIRMQDGTEKLLAHFASTKIMGATAYCTGLTLKDSSGKELNNEFIKQAANARLMILDLPQGVKNATYQGHVYSNIMDAPVAFEISDIKENGTIKANLDSLVKSINKEILNKEYYDVTQYNEAVESLKSSKDYATGYITLLKGYSTLREKLANPFAEAKINFIQVEAHSAFANPPGTDLILVKPWARVTEQDGSYIMTLDITTYSDWAGRQAIKEMRILDKEGKDLPINFDVNKDHVGTCSFALPYIPDDGIFKMVLTALNGREWPTDLAMDYTSIEKGMRPDLLKEAMDECNTYLQEDYNTKGKISEDLEDMFTKYSFDQFVQVLKECEEVLSKENRAELTQDKIDEMIVKMKTARNNLVFIEADNSSETIANKDEGIKNPENTYINDIPHALEAPWNGTRIVFGNKTYKVLNNGLRHDYDTGENIDSGIMLIMADDYHLDLPWTESDEMVRWDKSEVRRYLNDDFYNQMSDIEKSMILENEIKTKDIVLRAEIPAYDEDGPTITTKDYIYILDGKEMRSHAYGFATQGARKTYEYYFVRNILKSGDEYKLFGVKPKGTLENFNQKNNFKTAVYPVMNLSKSNILMTVDAKTGFNKGLKAIDGQTSNVWQLVVQGDKKDLEISNATKSNNEISLSYNSKLPLIAMVKRNEIMTQIGEVGIDGKANFTLNNFDESKDQLILATIKDVNKVLVMSHGYQLKMNEITEVEKPVEPTPTPTETPSVEKDMVGVHLNKEGKDTLSMGNGALVNKARVEKVDGGYKIFATFKEMKVQSLKGHLLKLLVEGKEAEVIKTDSEGRPVEVAFVVKGNPKKVKATVRVDVMDVLGGNKPSPQDVDFVFESDLDSLDLEPVVTPTEKPVPTPTAKPQPTATPTEKPQPTVKPQPTTEPSKPVDVMKETKVQLFKHGSNVLSMGNAALVHTAKYVKTNNGTQVFLTFTPITIQGLNGHLTRMTVDGKPVDIVKKDAEGNPTVIGFSTTKELSRIACSVQVDVMDMIAGQPSPQEADLVFGEVNPQVEQVNQPTEAPVVTPNPLPTPTPTATPTPTVIPTQVPSITPEYTTPNVQIPTVTPNNNITVDNNRLQAKNSISVHLNKAGTDQRSMGDNALVHEAKIEPNGNGYRVTMEFVPITVRGLEGHLINFSVNGSNVDVLERDASGNIKKVAFNVVGEPTKIGAVVEVDVMNQIAGKSSPQNVDIVFGKTTATAASEITGIDTPIATPSLLSTSTTPMLLKTPATLGSTTTSDVESNKPKKITKVVDGEEVEVLVDEEGKEITAKDLVKVELYKFKTDELSMGNDALEHVARYEEVEDEEGKYKVYLSFKPMQVSSLEGHLIHMLVEDQEVEVIEKDEDGNPTVIAFVVEGKPTKIKATVEVDVMNDIAGGSSPQDVDLVLEWDSEEAYEELLKDADDTDELSEEVDELNESMNLEAELEGGNLLAEKPIDTPLASKEGLGGGYTAPVAVGSVSLLAIAVWIAKLRHIF